MTELFKTVSMECPGEEWSPDKKQSVSKSAKRFSLKVRYGYAPKKRPRIILTGRGIDIEHFVESEPNLRKGKDDEERK